MKIKIFNREICDCALLATNSVMIRSSAEMRRIMLHPSYADLIKVVNSNVEDGEDPVVSSRYSIVMATSKRARQIIAGDDELVDGKGKKPLSVAVEELYQGKIKILNDETAGETEKTAETQAEVPAGE